MSETNVSNEGFTIKCNKCGHETVFTEEKNKFMNIVTSDDVISCGSSIYGGEVLFSCDCGNQIFG